MTVRSGSLFAGYGGLGIAVSEVFGATPAWFSEIDPGPSKILAHHWPTVPNYGDITQIDWSSVEPVEILDGGFPCQDVSTAGPRRGLGPGTRSGLWSAFAGAIEYLRPRYVVVENVRGLLSACANSEMEPCPGCMGDGRHRPVLRAIGRVLGDLADLGYDTRWHSLRASDVGAPHGRSRIFIVAEDANQPTRGQRWISAPRQAEGGRTWPYAGGRGGAPAADSSSPERRGPEPEDLAPGSEAAAELGERASELTWGQYDGAIRRWERITGRVAPSATSPGRTGDRLSPAFVEWMMGLPAGHVTGVPGLDRNGQLKALGNGVVPQQATAALSRLVVAEQVAA